MSVNTKKLEENIEYLEKKISGMILQNANRANETGEDLFTNADFNPQNILSVHFHQEAETLLSLSNECISLQEQASIDTSDSIAQLYLTACFESADLSNKHRRGPRKLAAWLYQAALKQNAL